MQFALRGQIERYSGLVREGWSTEIKDESQRQTMSVQLCTWSLYSFKSTVNRWSILVHVHTGGATVKHEDRTVVHHDDIPLC